MGHKCMWNTPWRIDHDYPIHERVGSYLVKSGKVTGLHEQPHQHGLSLSLPLSPILSALSTTGTIILMAGSAISCGHHNQPASSMWNYMLLAYGYQGWSSPVWSNGQDKVNQWERQSRAGEGRTKVEWEQIRPATGQGREITEPGSGCVWWQWQLMNSNSFRDLIPWPGPHRSAPVICVVYRLCGSTDLSGYLCTLETPPPKCKEQ